MKTIVYSLFGYERERHSDSFDFNSYLRGLMINIRMNRLLFPDWRINLQTDQATYEAWKELFDKLDIDVEVNNNNTPLTLAMLWRLKPIFELTKSGYPKYSHVLCRDLDSPPTYREAQAVQKWLNTETVAHAITDSVSHNIPMLGGMVGFKPDGFRIMVGVNSWNDLISKRQGLNWEMKGSDQTFLNEVIYPKLSRHGRSSITQHYFKGMPNTFLPHYYTCLCDSVVGHDPRCPNNTEINLDYSLSESNNVCGHIGSAGAYMPALNRFLTKHLDKFEDILEAEKSFPDVFYWVKGGGF